jgi:hypothetical protein
MTAYSDHDITKFVGHQSLVLGCDRVKDGAFRITTPFRYPESGNIDIFFKPFSESLFGEWLVSDYGITTAHLFDLHIKPLGTACRRAIVDEVCATYEIRRSGSEFTTIIDRPDANLRDAVFRLALCCLRISDLCYTQKFRMDVPFRDEVEEFIDSGGLEYQNHPSFVGRHGNTVSVDFLVSGSKTSTAVESVAAVREYSLHNALQNSFVKWTDLEALRRDFMFVTLIDERSESPRTPDIGRLRDVSTVLYFPSDKMTLQEIITA